MARRTRAPRLLPFAALCLSLAAAGACSSSAPVPRPTTTVEYGDPSTTTTVEYGDPCAATVLLHGDGTLAGGSAVVRPRFDCQAYAWSLIPWQGATPSVVFNAASEATLPNAPEFLERRAAACAVLFRVAHGEPPCP